MNSALKAVFRLTLLSGCATLFANGATISWAAWSSVTPGSPGSGIGSISGSPSIGVTYTGQAIGLLLNYPSWNPATSYTGGNVGNAPPAGNNSVQLTGGSSLVNTLTFSSPVTNPVVAIWSLGAPGNTASFNFQVPAAVMRLEAGGPSAEYGGSSITLSGNVVSGTEGNGVVSFAGTYSSLSWVNPGFENFYAFTVGVAGSAPPPTVPEPASLLLIAIGFALVLFVRKRYAAR